MNKKSKKSKKIKYRRMSQHNKLTNKYSYKKIYFGEGKKKKNIKKKLKPIYGGMNTLNNDWEELEHPVFVHKDRERVRKIKYPDPYSPRSMETEKQIALMLLENPQVNVVKVLEVGDDYVDYEKLLDYLDKEPDENYYEDIRKGLSQLNSLGIAYIDLKKENIGYSVKDGVWKIFDFDFSGIYNVETLEWIVPPAESIPYKWLHNLFDITEIDNLDNILFSEFRGSGGNVNQYAYLP